MLYIRLLCLVYQAKELPGDVMRERLEQQNLPRWLRLAAVASFLFFLVKGLAWLALIAFLALAAR